jgi:hypothetical protein
MPVIFDEVVASVEAPPPSGLEAVADIDTASSDDGSDKILRAIDLHQRRAERLMAD